jgi:hypothetical protein
MTHTIKIMGMAQNLVDLVLFVNYFVNSYERRPNPSPRFVFDHISNSPFCPPVAICRPWGCHAKQEKPLEVSSIVCASRFALCHKHSQPSSATEARRKLPG